MLNSDTCHLSQTHEQSGESPGVPAPAPTFDKGADRDLDVSRNLPFADFTALVCVCVCVIGMKRETFPIFS